MRSDDTTAQNIVGNMDERALKLMRDALRLRQHNVERGTPEMPVRVTLNWHTVKITVTIESRQPD